VKRRIEQVHLWQNMDQHDNGECRDQQNPPKPAYIAETHFAASISSISKLCQSGELDPGKKYLSTRSLGSTVRPG